MNDQSTSQRLESFGKPELADGFDLTPVDDGFIIYEKDNDRVHYLNHTAALVLLLCDGNTAAPDIIILVQQQFELEAPPDDQIVEILMQFRDEGFFT